MQDATADAGIARRVLAGERAAHAELYDRYGALLYAYCYSMLDSQEQAADAVGVTFIIAVGQLGRLHDLARLRLWLYALARNECRYRVNARAGSDNARSALGDAGGRRGIQQAQDGGRSSKALRAGDVEASEAAESGHAAAIVAAAIRGLTLDDREVVELCLRHHVLGPDLADVLGMPLGRAYEAVTRARVELRRALGTLLVAFRGREDCSDLAGMLADWDGERTALVIRRVRRHIGCCDTCRDRERRELQRETLAAFFAESAKSAPPPELRDDVLRLLGSVSPEMTTDVNLVRDLAARRGGSFGPHGFPAPRSKRGYWRIFHPEFAALAVVGIANGLIVILCGVTPSRVL